MIVQQSDVVNQATYTILVVEDDPGLREALVDTLDMAGFNPVAVSDGESALVKIGQQRPDLVISDINMPGMDGHTLLKSIRRGYCDLPVILMTAYGTIGAAVEAMREGANDYVTKPFSPDSLIKTLRPYLFRDNRPSQQPVAADPKSQQLLALAKRVAKTDATVLITGPSGTGKEVLARFVHQSSPRSDEAFVAINCAAIPENMLEATLFGYEKGAFTGAVQACPGKFEQAEKGTIFLDEIAEMDLALQAKLLRVLQEREVERLGGRKTIALDVRVLAATNQDLKRAVEEGRFREDLYYRLNVFPLQWVALQHRPLDILPIARSLLSKHAVMMQRLVPDISDTAAKALVQYTWPGNVRELDNVIQRALILQEGAILQADDLYLDTGCSIAQQIQLQSDDVGATYVVPQGYPQLDSLLDTAPQPKRADDLDESTDQDLQSDIRHHEFQIILDALKAFRGNRKKVSDKLGISPRTLRYKLAKMREEGFEIPDKHCAMQ